MTHHYNCGMCWQTWVCVGERECVWTSESESEKWMNIRKRMSPLLIYTASGIPLLLLTPPPPSHRHAHALALDLSYCTYKVSLGIIPAIVTWNSQAAVERALSMRVRRYR